MATKKTTAKRAKAAPKQTRGRGRPSIAEKAGKGREPSRMFAVRLPASEHEAIRALLDQRGVSATEWVRKIIRREAGLA